MGPPSTRFYNALHEQAIRHSVLAMLVFSLVALLSNLCLPHLVATPSWKRKGFEYLKSDDSCMTTEKLTLSRHLSSLPIRFLHKDSFTLPQAWMCSHILTSICLLGATFGNNFMSSVLFISLLGISWTLTQWAPFAIISAEISKDSPSYFNDRISPTQQSYSMGDELTGGMKTGVGLELEQEQTQEFKCELGGRYNETGAGTILGVHNIAIAVPQMISAGISSLIFLGARWIHIGETDALAWVLRFGVLAGACAAYSAWGMK